MSSDHELETVVASLLALADFENRIARVLRQTFDQLYDGRHTGRYRWDQLFKTEKTHCGTLVEINLQREFTLPDGEEMDYRIAGVEVDCKYSQLVGGWMIPPESVGHLCLLISANDEDSTWHLGVVRIVESILTRKGNRDSKRTITAPGRSQIQWIFDRAPLPPNVLLHLPRDTVDEIMQYASGQKRVNAIFRIAQQRRIGRGVIATLAQQDDYMKRVRGNGGARSILQREGILILGHYDAHRLIASQLGVPIPKLGELVSVRVARTSAEEPSVALIDGGYWRVAREADPVERAPNCPHVTQNRAASAPA